MSKQIGLDMFLYYNSATYQTPTWKLIPNVRDLTGADTLAEADVTRRNTLGPNFGFKQIEPTLREMSFEWDMIYDPLDVDFTEIQTRYYARELIEFAFADGEIATIGNNYLRVECKIFEFSRNEALTDANVYHIVAKPCFTDNALDLVAVTTAGAGSVLEAAAERAAERAAARAAEREDLAKAPGEKLASSRRPDPAEMK